jgi:hypothetical protein
VSNNEADFEYPEGARFGWDMLSMTNAEIDEMCDAIDRGDDEGAEAAIAKAEERLFHVA